MLLTVQIKEIGILTQKVYLCFLTQWKKKSVHEIRKEKKNPRAMFPKIACLNENLDSCNM